MQRFAVFWQAYPKRVGRAAAERIWMRLKVPEELFNRMLVAIDRAKFSEQWSMENGRFIPNPATWLNQGRWDDEPMPQGSINPKKREENINEQVKQRARERFGNVNRDAGEASETQV
jgi:hypothetical protein